MSQSHHPRFAVAIALVLATIATLFFAIPAAPVGAQPPSVWCVGAAAGPCLESVSVDGVAVTESDPTYDMVLHAFDVGGSRNIVWNVLLSAGGNDLGSSAHGEIWSVTIRTGDIIPRVVQTTGQPGTVARTSVPNTVTIVTAPATKTQGCDPRAWPWTCPSAATTEWEAYVGGEITDYGAWEDIAQRDAIYGYDVFSNVDVTSSPAEIVADPVTGEQRLLVRLANSHFRLDAVTPVVGFISMRIPNRFLRLTYGIDNPATLTGSGLSPALSGSGAGTVSVTTDSSAMRVEASGVSFSRRVIRLNRGVITPRRPVLTDARRFHAAKARLFFEPGAARGSRVRYHEARCRQPRTGQVVTRQMTRDGRIVVRGLQADRPYWCRVRAVAKAGPGPWSKRIRVVRSFIFIGQLQPPLTR